MKTILSTLTLLLGAGIFAQAEGQITFTTKIDMHAELPDDEQGKMLKSMIPQYSEMTSTLLFNDSESLFTNGEGTAEEQEVSNLDDEGNGMQIQIKMDTPDEKIYTDVANNLVVEQKELMEKTFLIRDTINPAEWKITGESKLVSGLNCMKATMDTEEGKVEAWFTSQIPVSSGPMGMGGLPGMIVHVTSREGRVICTASNIIARELEKGEIEEPKNGKDISREKFRKLEEKKMQQMQKQYSGHGDGDGNVMIITSE